MPSFLETLSLKEFLASDPAPALAHLVTEGLTNSSLCRVTMRASDLAGIIVIPNAEDPVHSKRRIAFSLDAEKLTLISNDPAAHHAVKALESSDLTPASRPITCLLTLLSQAVEDDSAHLRSYETEMEQLEEHIMDKPAAHLNRTILAMRRKLGAQVSYYDNLADVLDELSSSDLIAEEGDTHLIASLSRRVDRLCSLAQSLQDFSITLHQLYQAELDLRQNKTMRILTVVTTLFMPLTLIAGWYGMNFSNMPALNGAWGYPLVAGLCALIVIVELIIFARQGWFK